jgi:hypothetical protein
MGMVFGTLTTEMSDALAELGIDLEGLRWQALALCKGDDTEDHYDRYEVDEELAEAVDQKCLSCPVMIQCLSWAVDNNEWGVWGGIFLTNGKPDINRNKHKTQDVWQEIKEQIGAESIF